MKQGVMDYRKKVHEAAKAKHLERWKKSSISFGVSVGIIKRVDR
jgi:hypothetical protein